ncbi:hypothetical protein NPIL_149611 [Nephila pilipes]|uniref:Uncharacterized protein n=1 Tax=Nephila pilipes TaxID=299642 RepID=A0A8X6NB65_NEPPI|nr:hypothetical protein NPIL_149611 [Nephila pilipes]
MEILASESAAGTSSAREASERLGLPPSSIRNIFHEVLNQYLYKLQSCHELLLSDTLERSISEVYRSRPSNLSELKDAIRRELSCMQPNILHSAFTGFVTRLQCVIPCGGGHVEHILI